MKKLFLLAFLFIIFLLPSSTQAFMVKNENKVYLPSEEKIEDNLYTFGEEIEIAGEVDGDLIGFSNKIIIDGEVNGDLIAIAQEIIINGKINGDLRIAAQSITINGEVKRNTNLLGFDISLGENAKLKKDLLVMGSQGNIKGEIGGDLHGAMENLNIHGNIEKNVFLFFKDFPNSQQRPIVVSENANIKGDLNYTANNVGRIENIEKIEGEINHKVPQKANTEFKTINAWLDIFSIFAALVIGLVIISLFPKKTNELLKELQNKPGLKILIGAGIMFLTPIICFILLITIIGLPLAFLVFGALIALSYISKIIISIFIGEKLIQKFNPKKKVKPFWAMTFGVIITWTIFSIPVFGWSLSLLAIWLGLGTMFSLYRNNSK
jgi:cytoskeletal protein CcmA (bactofilin family)